MKKITQIWTKFSVLGLQQGEEHSHREVVLLNKITMVATLLVVAFIPIEIVLNGFQLVPMEIGSALIFLLCLFFNKKRWFTFAKYYSIFLSIILIFFMTYAVGGGSNSEFNLFPIALLPLLFFKNKKHIFFISSITVCLFFVLKYSYNHVTPIVHIPIDLKLKVQPIMNFMTMVLLFSELYYFKLINQSFENRLKKQKEKIEQSHNEIQSSINYAKRIQEALSPKNDDEREFLPNHFVFYKPKDVVSGDFYWTQKKGEYIYIAVGDCTGHGVPGGFLTMLAISFLNEIKLGDTLIPAQILDKLRDKVVNELSQKKGANRDGLDISLARLDLKNEKLDWAGANNPLYLLRSSVSPSGRDAEGREGIEITKGDRDPIGFTEIPTPFTNHKFDLQKGDTIYLFTDGYADQFGGSDGKKLGYKKFREKLVDISEGNMDTQQQKLSDYFEEWKGKEEQVDDVCIIGVKI